MNCQQFENLISDYLEAALSPPWHRQCAEHLIKCQHCRKLLNDVRAVINVCRQAKSVEPLTNLPARILRATAAGEMMSCSVFDELILDYFDGFISASEFHIFEAHFDTCSRCQRLLTAIRLARELCQELKSVEIPTGLHERIMDATTGADRRVRAHRQEGVIERLRLRLTSGVRKLVRPLLTPEFITAVLLCLATVGLLLVDFSDDMSLPGIYRRARLQGAAILQRRGGVSTGKEKIASDLQEVKTRLSRVIETGMALFSKTPEAKLQAPPEPLPDQKQPENHSLESTRESTASESREKQPPSQKPGT